jgi:hypothetical protein
MATDYTQTIDHKARRFMQIAHLERALTLKGSEVRDAKAHVKELEKEYDAILSEIRTAARDEGELPLIDMMEAPAGKAS